MQVSISRLFRVLSVAALSFGAAGMVQAQSVTPGLWEFKQDIQIPGMPDMQAQLAQMQEQLKSMPPEMRAMLEQQMAGAGVALGQNGAMRLCISPEEAAADPIYEGRQEGDCTYTNVKKRGNTWSGHVVCTEPPGKGDFKTTLHSPQHFTTEASLDGEDGRIDFRVDARRVGADCGALGRR